MNPLVTVAIATYNSSKFIIETLESVKAQTYDNIELIISDDCSTDDTVEVCRKWLEGNHHRFNRVELITSNKNTGVSANCNRSNFSAKGEWIKGLGGDDKLFPNSIENYVNYIKKHPQVRVVFGIRREFGNHVEKEIEKNNKARLKALSFWKLPTAEEQFWDLIVRSPAVHSCTSFIHRDTFLKVGGYDESIPMCEDIPFWIKLTKFGYRLDMMPIETVHYRIHSESIVHTKTKKGRNLRFRKILFEVYSKYRYPILRTIDSIYAQAMFYYYKREASENFKKLYYSFVFGTIKVLLFRFKKPHIRRAKYIERIDSPQLLSIHIDQGFVR